MPKNLLLIPVGSSGDVHPVMGLAIALKARGHRVTVCVNEYFRSLVERNGLEYVEFGTKKEYLDTIADPDVWHPRRGTKKVMGALVEKMLRPSYDYLLARYKSEKYELVSSPLCMGARLMNEIHGVPLVSTHLQPLIFRTAYEPPGIPGIDLPAWTPQWLIRLMFSFGDTFVIDPIICPSLNAFRKELGLKPVKHAMDWWNSPDCILGLWPDWFGAPQPDWPAHARLAGFPMYDERTVLALSPDLIEFLDAGAPPIAFTPGDASRQRLFPGRRRCLRDAPTPRPAAHALRRTDSAKASRRSQTRRLRPVQPAPPALRRARPPRRHRHHGARLPGRHPPINNAHGPRPARQHSETKTPRLRRRPAPQKVQSQSRRQKIAGTAHQPRSKKELRRRKRKLRKRKRPPKSLRNHRSRPE
jgi:hypothetical protein